jgi:hypothetical protein
MTTLTWFNDNNIEIDMSNYSRINEYINKLSNKQDEKNIETKINQIEKNYLDKLYEIEQLCNNPNDIIILKEKPGLIILQKELDIIKLLTKYTLQNKTLDYDFFIQCLIILLDLSETLRLRIGQDELLQDKIDKLTDNSNNKYENLISRCSYKFCSFQDNCTYNYSAKTNSSCYQDHYVHNMVSTDLKILLTYIKNKYENSKIILHNKEILKTINTLSYVIGHMELELRTKCLYVPESEWESYHVIKHVKA